MNLPTKSIDVWAPASETDQLQALILLGALPAREADSSGVDKAAYYLALEGATKHGLYEAAKAILKGSLGHAFFPNPVELRQQCDKAMFWHVRMRERVWIRERIARETPPDIPPRTEAEKARVAEVMREFHESYEREKQANIEAERAEIRARYGLTPEAIAHLPNQPLPEGMVQVGQVKPA
jgi:hypothetical protein